MLGLSWEYVSENYFQYESVSKTKINYDPLRKKAKSPFIWEEDFCVSFCDVLTEGEVTPRLPGLQRS